MKNLRRWKKWGLIAAGSFVLIRAGLLALSRIWWFEETVWYRGLMLVNYPPAKLTSLLLDWFDVPHLYDAPLNWREISIIYLTAFGLGAMWWFFVGAAVSAVWPWLSRRFHVMRKGAIKR